jgi:hypothetical protein
MSPADLDRLTLVDEMQTRRILRLTPAEWNALKAAGKAPIPAMTKPRALYRSCDVRNWIVGLPPVT